VCHDHMCEGWHTPVARGIHSPVRAQEGAPQRRSGHYLPVKAMVRHSKTRNASTKLALAERGSGRGGHQRIGVAAAMAHAVHATDDRRGRDEATGVVAATTARSRLGALARSRRRRPSALELSWRSGASGGKAQQRGRGGIGASAWRPLWRTRSTRQTIDDGRDRNAQRRWRLFQVSYVPSNGNNRNFNRTSSQGPASALRFNY